MSNSNPLNPPTKQVHNSTADIWDETRLQNTDNQRPTLSADGFLSWLSNLDWNNVFVWTARLTVIGFIGYAGYKLVNIWLMYPDWRFIAFLDLHTLLMLFSGVFVFFFLHHQDSEFIGLIALFSTVLNALLV